MHLDLNDTVAAAGLTPSAFHIEAETALLVSSCLGVGRGREQLADLIEHSCICGGIGSGRPPDGRLVDADHFVQLFLSQNFFVFSRYDPCPVQISCKCFIKHFVDQGALSGSADSGDTGHDPQRNVNVYIFQVVFRRAFYMKPSGRLFPDFRNRDPALSAQIRAL